MKRATVEICVGIFMLTAIAALLFLAIKVSGLTSLTSSNGFTITAEFQNVGSLKAAAPVSLAGVKIGEVRDIKIDAKTLNAVVSMRIDKKYEYTIAAPFAGANIYTAGLLGANYIALIPRNVDEEERQGKDNFIHEGSILESTQSAIILEDLIGHFLYKAAQTEKTAS